jgi:hypothetical protein
VAFCCGDVKKRERGSRKIALSIELGPLLIV